ncbi:MAG: threonine synthase [Nitrospirae bacterium]|nr:threonine synthase [Nitrospirota bacterium]
MALRAVSRKKTVRPRRRISRPASRPSKPAASARSGWKGVILEYWDYLPIRDRSAVVTLHEGHTPLIRSVDIVRQFPEGVEIYFKFEGTNPTGSFKDRGMTVAISRAKEEGAKAVICASTGNTSAAAAAYAGRAGMCAYVLIPEGNVALGKLCQAMMHGAKVLQIRGTFDRALELVRQIAKEHPVTIVNSINPYRLEGQKTAAFEIVDTLGRAPTYHALPVGNAGNIVAYYRGYRQYLKLGKARSAPVMLGFQAEGAAPIVRGHPVENPQSVASAIRIGNPANWQEALKTRDESRGLIDAVTDTEILAAYRLLAEREGVFCEPASAASVAGILKLAARRMFKRGDSIVCTLTGCGLKDPDSALSQASRPAVIPADLREVAAHMGFA